jgi:parallel beta-helix repeat protein
MRKKKVIIILIFTISLALISISLLDKNHKTIDLDRYDYKIIKSSDPPFNITHNDNFSSYANGGGTGSELSPWILQNYYIDASSTNDHGIWINDTTDHFILKNCTIIYTNKTKDGIRFDYVANGRIENCSIKHNGKHGVSILHSENITIFNNDIHNNSANMGDGIYLLQSTNNTIMSNIITQNNHAIYSFDQCSNNTIRDNIIDNNIGYGMILDWNCNYNKIINNSVINNKQRGIYLSGIIFNDVINNTCYNNSFEGIWVANSANNNTIKNNTISNTQFSEGIKIGSSGNIIEKNKIYNNFYNGITASYSSNSIKENIIFNNSGNGIGIFGTSHNLTKNYIYNNKLNGISLQISNQINILNNSVQKNEKNGII